MPDHQTIYQQAAGRYDRLVICEDAAGNLLIELNKLTSFEGQQIVELGAGTGRLTCLLAPLVRSIQAFDISPHMLEVAAGKLQASGLHNWQTRVSDHRQIPLGDGVADLVISGWSVCYIVVDHPETWRAELGRVLSEVRRLLRPGGTLLLIETLGTGFETPEPPPHLLEYYAWLKEQGFQQAWIRTDYRFESLEKARELAEFFFGKEMLAKIVETGGEITLPECTGLWWLKP